MFLRILAFPFILGIIILLYLAWTVDSGYAIYSLPLVIILAVGYIFSPQIEWWRAQKKPPELDKSIVFLLEKYSFFYQNLSAEEQVKFRHRVVLYMMAKEFKGQAMELVPEDIKGIVAANAVHLTFGREDFLFDNFENIIVYPHPFPSPQFRDHWHASEIFAEDGAILFSAEQLMASFVHPIKFYNIGLHEFCKILLVTYPDLDYPKFADTDWEKIETVSGWSQEYISAWIGLPEIELLPVALVTYLTFPTEFASEFPLQSQNMKTILSDSTL